MSREGSELSSSRLIQHLLELDVSVVAWGFGCVLNNKMFLSGFIPVTYTSLAVEWKDLQVLSP